jgi:hypothetical protein
MRIYRVEDWIRNEFKGPYAYFSEQEIHGAKANAHAWRDTHPLPPTEKLWVESRKDSGNYRYGFINLRQLFAWFEQDDRERLMAKGFEIVVYEVPDHVITFGQYQVSFEITDDLRMVEQLPLHEWEEDDDAEMRKLVDARMIEIREKETADAYH